MTPTAFSPVLDADFPQEAATGRPLIDSDVRKLPESGFTHQGVDQLGCLPSHLANESGPRMNHRLVLGQGL